MLTLPRFENDKNGGMLSIVNKITKIRGLYMQNLIKIHNTKSLECLDKGNPFSQTIL